MTVWFVDTSILCNVIPVPGKDQDRHAVAEQMKEMQQSRDVLILPVTAVVETGNHISQLKNGHERREAALTLERLVGLVVEGRAPWHLHTFPWDDVFLKKLIQGASTGVTLVDHVAAKVGVGDLCILVERDIYRERTGMLNVRIWTLDGRLGAYDAQCGGE